jgi:hypothetical protein
MNFALDDLSNIEDTDYIGIFDRRQSMSHSENDTIALFSYLRRYALDYVLALGI